MHLIVHKVLSDGMCVLIGVVSRRSHLGPEILDCTPHDPRVSQYFLFPLSNVLTKLVVQLIHRKSSMTQKIICPS